MALQKSVASLVEARQAVSSAAGMLGFTTDEGLTNHILLANPSPSSRSCQAHATTLDEALGSPDPIMLKIEVEGFETDLRRAAHSGETKFTRHSHGIGGLPNSAMIDFVFQLYRYKPFTQPDT